jgi:hypothetical protein
MGLLWQFARQKIALRAIFGGFMREAQQTARASQSQKLKFWESFRLFNFNTISLACPCNGTS